ncbi:GMC family oxidoreductase [Rhodococcus sp. 06-156-3C]|uniref:GMC oxidoreductase n=1 Tax=Nocardiaceae TaxID=85025 RepID=UPI00035D033A|nr:MULTISPECIES: GMC family oxidoreductase [Rhodococcus]OZC46778.1 GMC family oxidoreductase [Rhodococcus sp. 06-621-2]OZC77462.1 GMC family oxidoreductase [Rhodococcus sp. 06-418-1B]OZC77726.1 GMC family oxidoreductase [Rhodococcus sp. 06-418-1B]OZD14885.1 GMC family oxidoreductase [Rhodococcus sp. 06-156-4C]OZD20034.1 GMC family oxidoreductase [Rhodococcus sp. 06-156-4a]
MTHFDVLVIGSGFGGSVSALRAVEKGYSVGVLESGRRFADDQLPKTSWRLRKYLWAPALGCYGVQRIHLLPDVLVMAGAGVGGGSLNYANTLYQPPKRFFEDPQWAGITDWHRELGPYYDQAKRMLGVETNPTITPSDKVMKEVAEDMGVGETFTSTPVGVFFGQPGRTDPDPFFGGVGPARTGCTECGSCMTGCRVGAKNTLVKNYLHLAEHAGAQIFPLTTVTSVRPRAGGGYEVVTRRTGAKLRRADTVMTADQVVFAAGTYGTQKLLLAMKETGQLPKLSDRIGGLVRTNSEAVLAATARGREIDYTQGVAITSSFHPDDHTHIEPVRYGKGSNAIGLLQTVLSDGGGRTPRVLKTLGVALRHPGAALRSLSVRRWSERTVIALVMQTDDNSLELGSKKGLFGRRLTSRPGQGDPPPQWIPQGHEAIRMLADKIGGDPGGSIAEIVNIPMTAHFLGGCAIGENPERGVVDAYHRVYGYDGLHVVDGSAVSANLGVNPSLTITAQAERALALWPNKGETDQRPSQGQPYREIKPTQPRSPVVPASAPGALRLPLTVKGA